MSESIKVTNINNRYKLNKVTDDVREHPSY